MDALAGADFIINIPIIENGDYASLEPTDVITYSVYDIAGGIVDDLQNIEVPVLENNKNLLKINVPAEANSISEGSAFDIRFVIINYTLQGINHTIRQSYRVIPLIPYSCTENDVRNVLGLPGTVLTDDMIDIYKGYLELTSKSAKLDEKLRSTGIEHLKCDRAITLSTALQLKTTIPLLVPRLESDSIVSQTRYTFSLDDFMKLFDEIEDELNGLLDEIDEEDISSTYSPDMFVVGDINNIFTGEDS